MTRETLIERTVQTAELLNALNRQADAMDLRLETSEIFWGDDGDGHPRPKDKDRFSLQLVEVHPDTIVLDTRD